LLVVATAGVLLLIGCRRPSPEAPPPPKPIVKRNVVIYLVDTLRADHLGVYGYERDTSPRLDAFAKDAVVFQNAYAPSAWTKPSTASLLTGLHPRRHGGIRRDHTLSPRIELLSESLKSLGYHTAAFMTNPNTVALWGFDQGFDAFYDIHDPDKPPSADAVAERVFEHMDAQPDQPFFYYLHTMDPHDPYEAPPPYHGRWPRVTRRIDVSRYEKGSAPPPIVQDDRAAYDEEIAYGDEHFGRLIDRLKADGLYDDAFIVFTADHGEEFWDHGQVLHGHSLYNELVRVPFIIKLPGKAHAGTVVHADASLLDVVPTILNLLGQSTPNLDGADLMPLIESPADADPRPIFLDLDLERVGHQGEMFTGRAVVADGYKYVRMTAPVPRVSLFNLRVDPAEQNNLVGAEPKRRDHMAAALADFEAGIAAGVHLRILNAGDETDRTVMGRFVVQGGRFVDVKWRQFEESDTGRVSDDGRALAFEITLHNHPHLIADEPLFVVDEDHVSFNVEPSDATVTLVSLATRDGAAPPVYGGIERTPLAALPLTFRLDSQQLWAPSINQLLRVGGKKPLDFPGGCYLAIVPPREFLATEMSEEMRARLRALGYVK
jgi:arylsulfatase A-like enzyme